MNRPMAAKARTYNPPPMPRTSTRPALPLHTLILLVGLAATAASAPLRAQMTVEITGVGSQQYPIAVAPFKTDGTPPQDLASIVRADLTRSGQFRIIDAGETAVAEDDRIDLAQWRTRGADTLAVGSVSRLADGRYDVRFRLYDNVKNSQLDGVAYVATAEELRLTAHRIADRIYEKLTGDKGAFATRIAYVVQFSRSSYELQIADSDGANPQTALRSREPIISPIWSPDGSLLAYVSFETHKPVVYVHTLATGQRRAVANFRGSNSAPAFSPDGKTMAVVLSKDGNSEIYLIGIDGSNPRRLTFNDAIDTEPYFSGDGAWIYFTSDRGGSPQIYKMPAAGGDAQRITFNGDYNISPRVSPDGRLLAYVSRRNDLFQIQVLDMTQGQELTVTDTVKDESPSFAPNGRLLLYATEVGGRGILALASVDGRARARITGPSGDIREPCWGPYIK
jgi:TolB protein